MDAYNAVLAAQVGFVTEELAQLPGEDTEAWQNDLQQRLRNVDALPNLHGTRRAGINRRIWRPTTFRKPGLCRQIPPASPTKQPRTVSKNRACTSAAEDPWPKVVASASRIVSGVMKIAAKA